MEFLVKLIEVKETSCQSARDDLNANCTHVANNFWLFEGETWALHEGIDFHIAGEEIIESYGDLTGSRLTRMVADYFNVDTARK